MSRTHAGNHTMFGRHSSAFFLAVFDVAFTRFAAARECQDFNLSIPLTATNTVFDLSGPTSNIAVTDLILNLTQAGRNLAQELSTGTSQISGTYRVGATLCTPPSTSTTLQVLSHGIGFTRTYWDFPSYSYVDAALARGYATLTYDRLGSGASRLSSRTGGDLDPINELQAPLEVALVSALTSIARAGQLGQAGNASFDRVLHVGHSLGSISLYGAVAAVPGLSDGIALTGFTPNGSYVPYFHFASDFVSAAGGTAGYPGGYLTFATSSALHTNQFALGGAAFDAELLEPLFQSLQPTGVGTLLTLGSPLAGVNGFAGPVVDVTGCESPMSRCSKVDFEDA